MSSIAFPSEQSSCTLRAHRPALTICRMGTHSDGIELHVHRRNGLWDGTCSGRVLVQCMQHRTTTSIV